MHRQLNQLGMHALANVVSQSVRQEREREIEAARVNPEVALIMREDREAQERDMLIARMKAEQMSAAEKKKQKTMQNLQEEQDKTMKAKAALEKASTVVESMGALKRFPLPDMGYGHPQGGTRQHCANRRECRIFAGRSGQ